MYCGVVVVYFIIVSCHKIFILFYSTGGKYLYVVRKQCTVLLKDGKKCWNVSVQPYYTSILQDLTQTIIWAPVGRILTTVGGDSIRRGWDTWLLGNMMVIWDKPLYVILPIKGDPW